MRQNKIQMMFDRGFELPVIGSCNTDRPALAVNLDRTELESIANVRCGLDPIARYVISPLASMSALLYDISILLDIRNLSADIDPARLNDNFNDIQCRHPDKFDFR